MLPAPRFPGQGRDAALFQVVPDSLCRFFVPVSCRYSATDSVRGQARPSGVRTTSPPWVIVVMSQSSLYPRHFGEAR